jgi:nucleotidyltransferase/DNA polymerase involved in DNA repair
VTALMHGQRRILASVDDAAARLGLTCGMTVTHAQSLVPDLCVVNATPEEDEAALLRLALWCIRYSPLVTLDPPDGIFIDVAGSAHLFQGEGSLLKDLSQRLAAQGVTSKAAIADTPGRAWAVARFGGSDIVSPGRASEAIASLPVASLRLASTVVASLHEVGIERVAQIASKPRAGLRLRFGGDVLLRFDQALGSAQEALTSLIPPKVPRSELRFAEPVADPEDLKRIIELLCEKLCIELEARGIGARRLDLVFVRVDNITQAARIGLSRPYREPKHLARLLADRLVVIDPGFGIEVASLTASWVEALAEKQTVGRHVAEDGSEVDVSQDLQVTTHFSFLRGASSPEELFASAALLGITALGIVDRNTLLHAITQMGLLRHRTQDDQETASLAGIVRAYDAAKTTGVRLIVGCRLDLQCGTSLLVYPTDREAYGRLCRLLTIGKTRAGKGQCHIDWPDVETWHEGLLAILLPDDLSRELPGELIRLRRIFGDRAYCALTRRFLPDEAARLRMIATAASQARVATIATNDVLYHCASRRMLQDVASGV